MQMVRFPQKASGTLPSPHEGGDVLLHMLEVLWNSACLVNLVHIDVHVNSHCIPSHVSYGPFAQDFREYQAIGMWVADMSMGPSDIWRLNYFFLAQRSDKRKKTTRSNLFDDKCSYF